MGKCDKNIDAMCDKTDDLERTATALKAMTTAILKKQREKKPSSIPIDIR